jgi:hypothetical protein
MQRAWNGGAAAPTVGRRIVDFKFALAAESADNIDFPAHLGHRHLGTGGGHWGADGPMPETFWEGCCGAQGTARQQPATEQRKALTLLHSITSWRLDPYCGSTVWWKNDAEQYPFVGTCLSGSADMSTTVRRDHVVDLVVGNWRPFAVHLDFVMVADRSTLRWTTVQEITASAFSVVSVELQIEVLMPPFMADPVISLLRRCAGTKEDASEADYRYPSLNMRNHGGLRFTSLA